MNLLEKIWVLLSLSIIIIILVTNPKTSITNSWNDQFSTIFTSATDGQKFIKQLTWILIFVFFVLTLSLSYFI